MNKSITKAGAAAAAATALLATGAVAEECRIESPAHRVTVVELYTSEGCSSCPPADRWLSALPGQGVLPDNAILLAYHVDYWNQLGWPDRFSRPQYSERQRALAARSSAGFVYTPQFMLDGRDFRVGRSTEKLRARLAEINRQPQKADIRADIRRSDKELQVRGSATLTNSTQGSRAQVWVAVYENGLSTQVRAGENSGERLNHDFVVRDLAGPFGLGAAGRVNFDHLVKVGPDWNLDRVGIAVFAEDSATGEVLGAAARPSSCGS